MSKRRFKSIRIRRVNSRRPLRRLRLLTDRDRHAFSRRAYVNQRTLRREREFTDERTFWWVAAFVALLAYGFTTDSGTTVETLGIFAVFASINVLWTLVLGTAGVFSLGTNAIVGTAAFLGGWFALETGLGWWSMLLVGALVGLALGVAIGVPAQRLDGMYYALLTLGVVEVARTYFRQSDEFGAASGGLIGLPTFVPQEELFSLTGLRLKFVAAMVVLAATLVLYRVLTSHRLGLLLRTTRDSEAFGDAIGVDLTRIRLSLFVVSSTALGAVGGFYAAFNQSISPSIFSIDLLLLMFAMIVLGGMGSAEGVVVGTAVVVYINRELVEWGPTRIIAIGVATILIALFTKGGLYGLPEQYRRWRDKRKSERIAAQSVRDGDLTSDQAALASDKGVLAEARFQRDYRPMLRSLVTDELVAEHQQQPVGQHSPELERLLNYFRKGELAEKYAVMTIVPFEQYRVVALSGRRGTPPREVDDHVYATLDEAYHAVFLRRLQDLREE
jgi:branched-chain amino acid transport system permease protein